LIIRVDVWPGANVKVEGKHCVNVFLQIANCKMQEFDDGGRRLTQLIFGACADRVAFRSPGLSRFPLSLFWSRLDP